MSLRNYDEKISATVEDTDSSVNERMTEWGFDNVAWTPGVGCVKAVVIGNVHSGVAKVWLNYESGKDYYTADPDFLVPTGTHLAIDEGVSIHRVATIISSAVTNDRYRAVVTGFR